MCVARVDGTEVTGRVVAVHIVLGPDGIEGVLRPSSFPEVRALRGGDDPEPSWCSRGRLHPLILSETGLSEQAGPRTCRCRGTWAISARWALRLTASRAVHVDRDPSRGRARLLGLRSA